MSQVHISPSDIQAVAEKLPYSIQQVTDVAKMISPDKQTKENLEGLIQFSRSLKTGYPIDYLSTLCRELGNLDKLVDYINNGPDKGLKNRN